MARTHRGSNLVPIAVVLLAAVVLCCSRPEDAAFGRVEPELLAPSDGQKFKKYPRTIALEWRKVPLAKRYLVEIELQNPKTGVWMPAPVAMNRQFVTTERLYIEFPGDQPGRWRVLAINENGAKSTTSDWSHFEFLISTDR